MKDKKNKIMKSYVVCQFCCPGCNSKDIGKTKRNLYVPLEKHATDKGSSVFNHIVDCELPIYKILCCINNNYLRRTHIVLIIFKELQTLLIELRTGIHY